MAVRSFFIIITSSIETKSVFLFLFCAETGASVLHVHRLLSFFLLYVSHEYRVLTCYSPFETVQLAQEAKASLLDWALLFFLPSFPCGGCHLLPPSALALLMPLLLFLLEQACFYFVGAVWKPFSPPSAAIPT